MADVTGPSREQAQIHQELEPTSKLLSLVATTSQTTLYNTQDV